MRPLLLAALAVAAVLAASPEGRAQTPLGTFAEVDRLTGLRALDDGRVLIGVGGFEGVRVYNADGVDLGPFISGAFVSYPLYQLADGRVLLRTGGDELSVADADGSNFGVFADGLNDPVAATQLADGRVLVAEFGTTGSGRVSAYAPDGTRLPVFAPDADRPLALLQIPDGRVLVITDTFEFEIYTYAPDGTRLDPFIDGVDEGSDLLQLPDGRILVSGLGLSPGNDSDPVGMYSAEGEYLGPFAEEGLGYVSSIAQLDDGRVLVADATNDVVLAFGVIPVAGEPGPEANTTVSAAYPSPVEAGTPARLAVVMSEPGEVAVTVFDATGREVSREVHALGSGRQSVEIGTAGLAAGVYAVRVVGPGVEATRRLVVVR